MTKGIFSSVAMIAIVALTANTKTLTPAEALAKVNVENIRTNPSRMKSTMSTSSITKSSMQLAHTEKKDGLATVYLFSSKGGGYVCVAADDAVEDPLLGYSDTGTFSEEDMSPAMEWLLNQYSNEVAIASAYGETSSQLPDADWLQDIDPILDTRWGQTDYFNRYTPKINGVNTPTGCVATALAQVMSAHRWPEQPKGSVSYTWKYNGTSTTMAVDYDTISFNWDKVVNIPWQGGTQENFDEISKIMFAVGRGCKMQYAPGGSSSNYLSALKAIIENFDYAESTCYIERNYFEFNEWKNLLYNELAAGHPVPYCGQSMTEGHAFVCDGYRTGGYFHINWGWNGGNNGYFKLSALTPDKEYRAIAQAGYNMSQGMIIGMVPSYEETTPAIHLRVDGNFKTKSSSYARTGNVTFQFENGVFSMGHAKVTVTLGVKVVDQKGNVTYIPGTASRTFSSMSATQTFTVAGSEFPAADGLYEVYPVFRDENGLWHDVHVKIAANRSTSLTIKSSSLKFGDPTSTPNLIFENMELVTPLITGCNFSVKADVSNFGSEFHNMVYPVLLLDGEIVGISDAMCLNVPADGMEEAQWIGKIRAWRGATLTAGYYDLGLAVSASSGYEVISETIEVRLRSQLNQSTVVNASAVTIDNTYAAFSTSREPLPVSGMIVPCSVTLECTQGYFGENVNIRVTDLNGNRVYTTEPQFVGIESNQEVTLYAEIDLSALEEGNVYKLSTYSPGTVEIQNSDDMAAYITRGTIGRTSIASIEAQQSRLYPTMVSDIATVEALSPIKDIKVYSVSGESMTVDLNYDYTRATIGASRLNQGHYLVQVTTEDGQATVHRMLKR